VNESGRLQGVSVGLAPKMCGRDAAQFPVYQRNKAVLGFPFALPELA
jgi:hypothetical protein